MTNPTVNIGHFREGLFGRAVSFVTRQSVLFCTLIFALILSGTVPQGFMRSSDDDGIMLVLCTSGGPTEVWLSADGDILDDAPADNSAPDLPNCLAITLSLVLVQAWHDALVNTAEFSPYRATFINRRRALIAEQSPLQPRAPPTFS
ncbi:hypothetical protein [Celeribacter sp.]|uniref:hypothetical protein n=1 Tax=Celeribacter sp. TaxID=1890673 RepID=UPI003A92F30F